MKLEKGMLITPGSIEWYVVFEVVFYKNKTYLHCICDHANNIYSFEPNDIIAYLSIDEITNFNYDGFPNRKFSNDQYKRDIPYDVIHEAILGTQKNRFSHWTKGE